NACFRGFGDGWHSFPLFKERAGPDALAKGDAPVTGGIFIVDEKGEAGTGDLPADGLPDCPVGDNAPAQGHEGNAVAFCRVDGERRDPPGKVVLDGSRDVPDSVPLALLYSG